MEYFVSVGPTLLFCSPVLVGWIVGIILATRMLKKGGGKAERLLLIGCCLMLAEMLISPFAQVFTIRLIEERTITVQSIGITLGIAGIPFAIISLAGIVCLIYAFWIKFRSKHEATP